MNEADEAKKEAAIEQSLEQPVVEEKAERYGKGVRSIRPPRTLSIERVRAFQHLKTNYNKSVAVARAKWDADQREALIKIEAENLKF